MREACLRQLPSSIFESAPEVITVSTNPAPGQPFDDPKSTWNRRFDSPDYVFGTQPNDWLKRKVQAFAAGGRILCVADGEGRNSVWLAAQGYQVDAFDISDRGVAKAKQLADNIIDQGLSGVDEIWAMEQPLYYPGLYAGTSDLIGVYGGEPAIMDHKQSNKLKKREWIDDYFLQLAAYATAHNEVHNTKIRKGVIFMCTADNVYQEFIIEGVEFDDYVNKWFHKLEEYYTKIS